MTLEHPHFHYEIHLWNDGFSIVIQGGNQGFGEFSSVSSKLLPASTKKTLDTQRRYGTCCGAVVERNSWPLKTMTGHPCVESGLQVIQFVTFLIPNRWRSLNVWKGHLTIPKRSEKLFDVVWSFPFLASKNSTRLVPLTQKISRSSSQQWG